MRRAENIGYEVGGMLWRSWVVVKMRIRCSELMTGVNLTDGNRDSLFGAKIADI